MCYCRMETRMSKRVMTRSAADNAYLHKDFHGALSAAIAYLHERYGANAVRDYLRQFAAAYYAPLTDAINQRGLTALREHLARVYTIEEQEVAITGTDDELWLDVPRCPAVAHMRELGYPIAELFYETSRTVYQTICDGTLFAVEMLAHDPDTGRARFHFFRRPA
ncbi:MAG: hypothetical protein BWY76_02410 [bacterium ADurb.Bin429]|nr:MAG: hypothetical protein BWY76_02410 [bacterium ADurb.Bin429]